MHDAAGIGPPDALKGACPVRAGAGGKPTAERQKWAPSFDQHSGHYSVPDDQPCDLVSQQTINLATSCRSISPS